MMDRHQEYIELSDEQLVDRYRLGDQAVLNHICEKYKPLVLKVSKKYFLVGGDSEDIIQEGMIGLFGAINDFDTSGEVTFFHFANLCIERQMIKAIEANNRKKHSPLNSYVSLYGEDGEVMEESLSSADDPAELIVEAEQTTNLMDRLKEVLSPMERQVFDLYMRDFDYKEIAASLGKTEKSIDNTLTRIKGKAKAL